MSIHIYADGRQFNLCEVKIAGRLEVSYFMVVPFLSRKKFIFIDSWMVV